ncbi:TPM domain-containing protein [Herbiconiux sp. 11R-BC]|uniref:TPM domain-containing protein n=1 Tax=Herbiconiux sp. 11R-BC TaxID=3111637 RepID=UPI003C08C448
MRHPHKTPRAVSLRTLLLAAVAAIGLALLAPASAAVAGDPVTLNGRYIVDEVGVLDQSGTARVQDAIDTLATEQGVNLFVVYTDSFTNPSDRQAWAEQVATVNQFGTNDVLLAVATTDRLYQFSVASDFALSDTQLTAIETQDIVPALRQGDWAGAAAGAAEGLGRELAGSGSSGSTGSTGSTASDGGFGGLVWVLAIVIIVVVAAIVLILVLRRRRSIDKTVTANAAAQVAAQGPTQKELDRQVGAVLVDLDDAVTTSEEELGFAVAQFGAEAAAPFTAVLGEVKTTLSQAFTLKQKLDDAVPDTEEERRAWSQQIIALCDQAADQLDEQAEAFAALRDLERDPVPALSAATNDLQALTGSGTQARERLAGLTARYDAPALSTVVGGVEQADRLRDFAQQQLEAAATAAKEGRAGEAAVQIRAAQQAVVQAQTLMASLVKLESDLAAAGSALAAAIADAQQDLAEVARVQASGTAADPELARLAAAVSVELQRAQTTGPRDPLNARIALEAADAPLDAALLSARGEQERATRLGAQRDRSIAAAQSEIAAAQAYLQTRRGAVGPDARTRLSEAQRHLDLAVSVAISDPESSIREAGMAAQLASRASASAQQDVSWAQTGGNQGMPTGGGGGGDFTGALLGGIIGGLLGGGGGGRSGGYGGGFGGFGGFGGGGGSSRGGWGGGSRGGGGGFGGSSGAGGRRGGGGRF